MTLDHISFGYGKKPVITDFSLTLPQAGTVCLFGNSGCGKTTLLRLLAGLEKPSSGTIHRPDSQKVAMVFQENRLAPWLTVQQNVELVLPDSDPAIVADCLAAVSLSDHADCYPHELSGGMQRRVAIARALAYGGDLLLLDEPFNGLDDNLKAQIATALCQRFDHCPIVLVTHSAEEAALFDATILHL